MTTSAEYTAKDKDLKDDLEKVEKSEAAALRREGYNALIARAEARNKELEGEITPLCHGLEDFKKEHPRAYREALDHAKDACEDEPTICIAKEMNSIMYIARIAAGEL